MTLGQLLKQKRQESGRSLEQLAALTKIHIKILGALEEDSYGTLPARAFTRGFIVNYAKALKLNPEEVLKEHHAFLEQKFSERGERDKGHQGYVFEGKELEQNRRWLVVGASIAIVFAAATLLVFKPQNHKHKEQHKEFEEETQTNEDGEPIAAAKAVQIIPFAPINGTQISSAAPVASVNSVSSSSAPVNASTVIAHSSTPVATSAPVVATAVTTSAATPAPTAAPVSTPVKAASTPAPASTATPEPSPSASPAKEDKLNKGDALDAKEVKVKVSFQAKEDTYVRYKADDRPMGILILRKDRYLVIKAKTQIVYEVTKAENLRYKTKSGYQDVTQTKGEISSDGSIQDYSGSALGSAPLPESVPLPASH